jgi:undecaprenyl-diphosphatase
MHPILRRCSSVEYRPVDMRPPRALHDGRLGPLGASTYFRDRTLAGNVTETLLGWDTAVFRLLNEQLHCMLLDVVMPFVTAEENWRIPLVAAWLAIMAFGGRRGRITGLGIAVAVTASDQMCASFLKDLVGRVRPCHVVEGVRLLDSCRGSPSFPSCHASNSMAVAVVALIRHRRWTAPALAIAAMAGYSRIYVGVHYPSDVLGGMLLGAAIGCLGAWLVRRLELWLESRRKQ